METDKPKRKRKSGMSRTQRGLIAGALLLLMVGLAGGVIYWQSQPPLPPLMSPTPTEIPFELPPQCSLTTTYEMRVSSPDPYYYDPRRIINSNSGAYQVTYSADGVVVTTKNSDQPPVKLLPAFADMYSHQVAWSGNEKLMVYLDGTRLMVANGNGTEAHTIRDGVTAFRGMSPDNSHIIYFDGERLWLAQIDGSAARPISDSFDTGTYIGIAPWSPDSRYVALVKNNLTEHSLTIIPADASEPVLIQDVPGVNQDDVFWAPDSRSVAFFTRNSEMALIGLTLASMDGARRFDIVLPPGTYPLSDPLRWSLDSQQVAVLLRLPVADSGVTPISLSVYGLDGTSLPLVSTNLVEFSALTRYEDVNTALWHRWSPEGSVFYYWESGSDQIALKALDTSSGAIDLKFTSVVDVIFYAPGTSRLISFASRAESASIFRLEPDGSTVSLTPTALEYASEPVWANEQRNSFAIKGRRGMNYAIAVVDVQTGSALELLPDDATDAGDPNWSPKASFVAATYAVSGATPADRHVNLVWHNLQSGETQTLADDFLSIYSLAWSADERYLAFAAWRAEGTSLEMIDTTTGEHKVVLKKVDALESITYDPDRQIFVTVWSEGQQPYYQEFQWEQTVSPALALTPNTIRRNYFWSPDGDVLLVKSFYKGKIRYTDSEGITRTYNTYYETLLMTTRADQPHILADTLIGLGNPNWSPDGTLIAYTQWTKERELSLRITDAAGHELWAYPLPRSYRFEWVPCSGE